MKKLLIEAFEAFENLYNGYKQKTGENNYKNVIVLFTGNEDPKTGKSWCPYCVYAMPVIDKAISTLINDEHVALVTVKVGHREEWKRPDNPYRLHELKINCIPTLISLSNNLRLNGKDCCDQAKVNHLFTNSV